LSIVKLNVYADGSENLFTGLLCRRDERSEGKGVNFLWDDKRYC